MVAHARVLIAQGGIASLSVNEVLRLAGGSKATLVKYFGDRNGLIAAAIGEEACEAMSALDLDTGAIASAPLADALRVTLTGVLRFYMQPVAIAIYRAVVAMGAQDCSMAAALYDHGHRHIVDTVEALLHARAGTAHAQDPVLRDMAEQMVHAIRAGWHEQALLGLIQLPVPDIELSNRVEATVALVLPGLQAALRA